MNHYIKEIIALLAVLMFCAVYCFATNEYVLAVLGTAGTVFTLMVLVYLYDVIFSRRRREEYRAKKKAEMEFIDRKMASEELFRSYAYATTESEVR